MTIFLRQSTASQEVPLGYFVDSTDGNTEETALTIANTDIKIWKAGATTLANKNSGGATHISNGIYYAVLDATDTDTIGSLRIFVHVSGALAVKVDCVVLDEAVYDVLFGTTALATTTNITAGTITNVTTVNGLAAGVVTASSIAADAITAAKLASDAVAEIADAVWDEATTGHTTSGTFGEQVKTDIDEILIDTGTTLDGRIPAALVGGRMDSNVGAISTDATAADNAEAFFDGTGYAGTGNVIPTVTNLTNPPSWNSAWDAEVQSEVQDALDATVADSVPADGTRPSISQAVLMLTRFLGERSVSGTTVTVKKEDGSTTSMTFTLNDATSPTSITRAS